MDDLSSFEAQKKRSNPYQLPGVVEQASNDKKSIAYTLASEESLLEGRKREPAARGGKKFFFFLFFFFLLTSPSKVTKATSPYAATAADVSASLKAFSTGYSIRGEQKSASSSPFFFFLFFFLQISRKCFQILTPLSCKPDKIVWPILELIVRRGTTCVGMNQPLHKEVES
jgi:hypothetical protein